MHLWLFIVVDGVFVHASVHDGLGSDCPGSLSESCPDGGSGSGSGAGAGELRDRDCC